MIVKAFTKGFPGMKFLEFNSPSLGSFPGNFRLNQLGVGRDV